MHHESRARENIDKVWRGGWIREERENIDKVWRGGWIREEVEEGEYEGDEVQTDVGVMGRETRQLEVGGHELLRL